MEKIAIFHLVWGPAFIGLGSLLGAGLCRLFGLSLSKIGTWDLGILGTFTLAFAAMLANFFFPITSLFSLLACLLGWVAFGYGACKIFRRLDWVQWLTLFCVTGLSIALSYFSEPTFDYGLYYMPVTEWIRQFPAPFGLSNLYSVYGYNSILYFLQAGVELPPLLGVGQFLPISLLTIFILLSLIDCVVSGECIPSKILAALILVFFATDSYKLGLGIGIGSTNDLTARIGIYAVFLLYRSYFSKGSESFILSLLITGYCFLIKQSALPLVMLAGVLALWTYKEKAKLISVWKLVFVFALIGIPFLIRGLMLSGCWLYPAAATCHYSLEWSATPAQTTHLNQVIHSGQDLSSADFTADFYETENKNSKAQFLTESWGLIYPYHAIAILCLVLIWISRKLKFRPKRQQILFAVLVGFQWAGIIFVYTQAPRVRYAYQYICLASILVLTWAILQMPVIDKWCLDKRICRAMVLIFLSLTFYHSRYLRNAPLVGSDWPRLNKPQSVEFYSDDGEQIRRPQQGPSCFDLKPPCTPLRLSKVQVRRTGNRFYFIAITQDNISQESYDGF